MNTYKLLFLDIDGTIITQDDTIDDSTKVAVSAVQEKGIEVFLATGRPIHEIQDIAKELSIHSFIGYNGAQAIYKGKELFKEPMNPDTVSLFLQLADTHRHDLALFTRTQNAFTTLNTEIINEFIHTFHLHNNILYKPEILEDVLSMTLINLKKDDLQHYQIDQELHLSQINIDGMENCYDVIRTRVNKGTGINTVLHRLGIDKESAIAFGDGLNDKEMLMNVGEGIAMGNAHPDLFAFAKHKTTDVNNSGIYNGLKMLGLIDQ